MSHNEKPFLSAALLACNDEDHIVRTLASIKDVADEVCIVLDAKSTDRTEVLIRRFKRKWKRGKVLVNKRTWTHSYSEARNEAFRLSTGVWVMVLDADEELAKGDGEKLLEVLRADELDIITCPFFVNATYETPTMHEAGFGDFCSVDFRNRVFRNELVPRYKGRVHELPYFEKAQGELEEQVMDRVVDVRFYHRGNFATHKRDYYRALLVLDSMDFPDDPLPAIYLADEALNDRKVQKAIKLLEQHNPDAIAQMGKVLASRWWGCMGKARQLTWGSLKQQAEQSPTPPTDAEILEHKRMADSSIEAFHQAHTLNPNYVVAKVQEAVMHLLSGGLDGLGKAAHLLAEVADTHPDNVVAVELLTFLTDFFQGTAEDADVETIKAHYQQLLNKVGTYLSELNSQEVREKQKADGLHPAVKPVVLQVLQEEAPPDRPLVAAGAGVQETPAFQIGDR